MSGDTGRDRVARATAALEDAQKRVEDLTRLSEPTPADSVDEAADQASQLRAAVDRDLDALQAKLPPRDQLVAKAKTYGGAAVGVAAVLAAALVRQKQRGEQKRIEREARAHAAAIAPYLPGASSGPETTSGRRGKGTLALLAVAGAAVVAFVVSRTSNEAGDPDIWGPAR